MAVADSDVRLERCSEPLGTCIRLAERTEIPTRIDDSKHAFPTTVFVKHHTRELIGDSRH